MSKCNHTRFDAKRHSGERLIIYSAFVGVLLLMLGYVVCHVVAVRFSIAYSLWHGFVPFPHAATSLVAFVIGCFGWMPFNLYWKQEAEAKRAILERHDYLEILLFNAATQNRQVALTLERGKVYVGFVLSLFDPSYDRRFITILPTLSGYRDAQTHELKFTTNYTPVYQRMIEEQQSRIHTGNDDFEVVLPVSKIVSAANFDPQVYRHFNPSTAIGENTGP